MKVAVLGASGWIGGHIVAEAVARGHQVVALVRDTSKVTRDDVEVREFDLLAEGADLAKAVEGVDAVISAIGGRAAGNHDIVVRTAETLLQALPQHGVNRLLWVGGAGSLEVAPGVALISLPDFPEAYKPEAEVMGQALAVFRASDSTLNWTFVSPAAEIFPGEKQAPYRVGGDQLLSDEEGNSRISVSDYAVAMIDELERSQYPQQRIGVAY
ncbi:NAD(P)-dependent oxidoreductase [Vibrio sp. V39_P1S14PM300]|uniref:NAD(P)-dependent oxidoreductase n=1 Tax=Vibrio sp. V39_P1S14PM300 TaxID=1938690 RepID=UPI0013726924|nr:NAD(P)-dependent oxidoreductase [Vibrio sp. V39_P1S14PM300]NAX21261.1 NAD(P)H-binding protein [Vibrio sp. V39_P1S14PM300]